MPRRPTTAPRQNGRISTAASAAPAKRTNYSLDTQEAACRAHAASGAQVASVAREVWSGTDRHRPALDALLDRLLPGDVVLAYDLDRLSRGGQIDTAVIIDRIESAGASVAFVTLDFEKSETGALLRNVRAFAAALEREKIAERTQRGRRARVASGKPSSRRKPRSATCGTPKRAPIVIDPETAPVVRKIFDMALAGVTLRGIGAHLEERGIPSPSGGPTWTPTSVRQILTRSSYAGERVAYRERFLRRPKRWICANHRPADEHIVLPHVAPPLVGTEDLATVAARLATNKAHATRNNRSPEATLLRAGFVTCGHCAQRLAVKNPPITQPDRSPRYTCPPRPTRIPNCPHPTISAALLDGPVWDSVVAVLRDPTIIAREVEQRRDDGSLDRDLADLDKLIVALADKQTRMARRVAEIDDDDVAAPLIVELKALAERKAAARREREALVQRMANRAEDESKFTSLAAWCQRVGANLDLMTYEEKRLALHALGVHVRVQPRVGRAITTGTRCRAGK